ncbi:hypothetical protein I6A84_37550 [Frankia sp. CNm7]|uniref:Uncharacterized protein n=1 Tax=Frankia nepalensis TaxID=1836974 RepID=A0A937ULJ1_9ACTN|nr:hypothetical protein [Frankia nepalensis]MBL7496984.1 hypothetical protein [Frankia nepalensis]MBL7511315.1 hypothetical protein [Frankia nepalensis]MBL7523603.1 hypothetical protein [Frankia nepalensis]MBL7626083.1 hypothetical protein [Frankia nepalensis]
MYTDPMTVKILVVALCVTASVCVALVAGYLERRAGAHPAAAVQRGGTAFAGALALQLLVLTTLGAL